MRPEDHESFETFYKDVRSGLLLQTYALTGDLQASEKAVRDAMVVGWHHWRKVSRLDDPEEYVRPLAWTRALRRSQTRWWSRMKGLDPDVASHPRRAGQAAGHPAARAPAQPPDVAPARGHRPRGRHLTADRRARAADRDRAVRGRTATSSRTAIRPALEALGQQVDDVRWPRPSIITRAGSARRRSHTTFGAAVAVAAVVVSGSVVTDAAGVRPEPGDQGRPRGRAARRAADEPPRARRSSSCTPESLLTADQVGASLDGQWTQGQTSGNTQGDGLAFTCQGGRYADPAGLAALLRTFKQDEDDEPASGQYVEVSADEDAGKETYRTTARWYAGCAAPRVQLLSTQQVKDVGDDAMLFVLRDWTDPTSGPGRRGRPHRQRHHDHVADPAGREDPAGRGQRGPARRSRRRPLRAARRRARAPTCRSSSP